MTIAVDPGRLAAAFRRLRRRLAGPRSVADVWGEQAGTWSIGGVRHWTELQQVHDVINRRVSGDRAVDPYLYFLRTHLAGRLPVARALTIGCGGGDLERGLCQHGFARRHDGVDVAPKAIEKAATAAREAGLSGLEYSVVDGNALDLAEGVYDVVFGVHSIHHIENLEDLFAKIARALKPDGFLFLNEFVGPTRFQWTDRQLEVVNGLLRVLPASLRAGATNGRVRREALRPTVKEMMAADPSEAARSGELLGVAESYFEFVDVKPYGGTVLQLLLEDIAGNFARSGRARGRCSTRSSISSGRSSSRATSRATSRSSSRSRGDRARGDLGLA